MRVTVEIYSIPASNELILSTELGCLLSITNEWISPLGLLIVFVALIIALGAIGKPDPSR